MQQGVRSNLHPAPSRFPAIDLLRGLSILAVILLHIWIRFYFAKAHVDDTVPRWLGHLLFHNGGNGVTVFFCISGFLITLTSLQRFGSLSAMRAGVFYRIRFARIAPSLLLLLAVLSLLHLVRVDGFIINRARASLPCAIFSALTFTLNRYEAVHMHGYLPACWTVLWSLSIEEMFYLLFPVACLLLLRPRPVIASRGMPILVALLLALVVAGCFARTIWSHGDDLAQENSYLAGMGDIAVGVLAALLTHRVAARRRLPSPALLGILQGLGAATILLFALYPAWSWIHPFLHFTAVSGTDDALLSLGTALVMFASVLRNPAGSRLTAPLRWLGRHSYELYLTHEFVVMATVTLFLRHHASPSRASLLLWVAGAVLLTLPLGWALSRFVSEPLNRRLRQRRKAAAPPTVQLSHT